MDFDDASSLKALDFNRPIRFGINEATPTTSADPPLNLLDEDVLLKLETVNVFPELETPSARPAHFTATQTRTCENDVSTSKPPVASDPPVRLVPRFHFRSDLQASSRFSEAELRTHWTRLVCVALMTGLNFREQVKLLGLDTEMVELDSGLASILGILADSQTKESTEPAPGIEHVDPLYSKPTQDPAVPIPDPAGLSDRSLPYIRIDVEKLDGTTFDTLWSKGEPLIMDHVDRGMRMGWTPDYFIDRFGGEVCGMFAT
jgi:hypothetical protein